MSPIHTKELKPGVALITGGAKRIGKEIVKNLAYDGWKVIIPVSYTHLTLPTKA